tara:strand:+ start:291 stop:608 length:318 start_codon:yes stop_codon:yes gene_type:complete
MAKAIYDRMIAGELANWKGIGQCGMAERGSREFCDTMLERLVKTGNARIIIATHEDKDIGIICSSIVGKIYRVQLFSFDKECAHVLVQLWTKRNIGPSACGVMRG